MVMSTQAPRMPRQPSVPNWIGPGSQGQGGENHQTARAIHSFVAAAPGLRGDNKVPAWCRPLAPYAWAMPLLPLKSRVVTNRLLRSWLRFASRRAWLDRHGTPAKRRLSAHSHPAARRQQRCFVGLLGKIPGSGRGRLRSRRRARWGPCGWWKQVPGAAAGQAIPPPAGAHRRQQAAGGSPWPTRPALARRGDGFNPGSTA